MSDYKLKITIKSETPYGLVHQVLENPIPEKMQTEGNLQEFIRLCFSTIRFSALQGLKEKIERNEKYVCDD